LLTFISPSFCRQPVISRHFGMAGMADMAAIQRVRRLHLDDNPDEPPREFKRRVVIRDPTAAVAA
jgi:hypothetical protein